MQGLGIRLAAVAAICVMASAANAAPPKLSGKYAFQATTFCAATLEVARGPGVKKITLNGGSVTSVVNQQVTVDVATTLGGMISSNIGYITFNNPAPGQLTITGSTLVEGAAVRVQGKSSFAWGTTADNQNAVPFSNTTTTFTFGSGEEAEVYQMVYADPVEGTAGIFRTVYLMRRSTQGDPPNENPDCVTNVQATRVND